MLKKSSILLFFFVILALVYFLKTLPILIVFTPAQFACLPYLAETF